MRLSFVLAWGLVVAVAAAAQGVKSPVFRGVMGLGSRNVVLFEIPGASGNWQGELGSTIPGTAWKITRVNLNPGQVVLDVGGKKSVTLVQGDTYISGHRAVRAPEVERPKVVETREFVAAPPPGPEELTRRRERALHQQKDQQKAAQDTQDAQDAQVKPAASADGLIDRVDVSKSTPSVSLFAQKGFLTAVMVTSPACGVCKLAKPALETLPMRKGRTRVVFLDVGVNDRGGINTTAPFMLANKINFLPYFFLLDEAGNVGVQGEAATKALQKWVTW